MSQLVRPHRNLTFGPGDIESSLRVFTTRIRLGDDPQVTTAGAATGAGISLWSSSEHEYYSSWRME